MCIEESQTGTLRPWHGVYGILFLYVESYSDVVITAHFISSSPNHEALLLN